jgi:hypothetical protein
LHAVILKHIDLHEPKIDLMPFLSYFHVATERNWLINTNIDVLRLIAKLNEDTYFAHVEFPSDLLSQKLEIVLKELRPVLECQKHSIKFESSGLTENLRFKANIVYLIMLIQNLLRILLLSSTRNRFI